MPIISISKSDLLQSIGFAVTAAGEDYERTSEHMKLGIAQAVFEGGVITPEAQKTAAKRMRKLRAAVEHLKLMERMANFAKDDEPIQIDSREFELIERNLPAR